MKKISVVVMVVFMWIMYQQAYAADVVITTGGETGNYFKVGNKLAGMIKGTTVQTSKGSVDNIEKIVAGTAQIGMTQMDALAWYLSKNPAAASKIEVIGPLYEECIFVAVSTDGKVKNEDDLQSDKATVAVGEEGSGSAVSWDYMRILEPGYAKAKVSFDGGLRTLGKLTVASGQGDANAVMFVQKPDPENKLISTVAGNKKLKFIDVDDSDLNDKLPLTGKPVYTFKTVAVDKSFLATKVTVPCVDAAIIASKTTDGKLLDRLSDITLNYKTSLQ